ncbi:ATP-binding cassette domain-containing protein [Flavobacterium sp. TP390]|uniref:ATP-binding cassette domain-containing protein n=1 Tax=Flavobacterium profundi TaxID=1774945 RepID=A0A6I4IKK4_9FLAO|nr:ATP-binding cassette domain-containing protein [Flavobacterium profundi]MVO08502.1 ATP-binding cassette domain-containing protein [Flavobacterium profundi]
MKNVLIDIKDVTKSFGTQDILKGVTLQLFENENLVILGKSGTGKSVLIKCIVNLLQLDSGCIKVEDYEIANSSDEDLIEVRKKIGFLFQGAALYDSMTVRENLTFPLTRLDKKFSNEEITQKIEKVLEDVSLPEAIDKMPSELSGGMKKRIGLARTLIVNPKILLYDEPTTGLDPITSDEISQLINETKNKFKTSSIIITHDIKCVQTVADRIIMLKDGVVYKEGTLSEFENDDDSYIQSFFN